MHSLFNLHLHHYVLLLLLPSTLTLTLALPSHPLTEQNYCTSNRVPWSISHFSTYTTTHKTKPAHKNTIAFTFHDANNGLTISCERSIASDSSDPIIDTDNFYACADSQVQYLYYGDGITIREGVGCGK